MVSLEARDQRLSTDECHIAIASRLPVLPQLRCRAGLRLCRPRRPKTPWSPSVPEGTRPRMRTWRRSVSGLIADRSTCRGLASPGQASVLGINEAVVRSGLPPSAAGASPRHSRPAWRQPAAVPLVKQSRSKPGDCCLPSHPNAVEYSPFYGIEKGAVLQEARVFNEPHVDPRKCQQVITKLLYLLTQGETFTKVGSPTAGNWGAAFAHAFHCAAVVGSLLIRLGAHPSSCCLAHPLGCQLGIY